MPAVFLTNLGAGTDRALKRMTGSLGSYPCDRGANSCRTKIKR